jgi:antitoxin ParD1/3/4
MGGVMGTNINLTPELERFAQACVESGRFNNVSEVVRPVCGCSRKPRNVGQLLWSPERRRGGLREGFATVNEVEADVRAAINMVRKRRT